MMYIILVTALCLLQPTSVWAEGSVVPAPWDVSFHSVNLRNRLRWTNGQGGLSQTTTYTVEYAIYGDAVEGENSEQVAWHAVKQCTDIIQTQCDLTNQTYNLDDEYYARVRVSGPSGISNWTETKHRFKPVTETILGPPQMEVSLTENNMHVSLKGPFRSKSGRKKGRQSLWMIFPHMVYNVTVYNNRSKHTHFFLLTNGSLRLGPLDFDSEYCVTAESHSLSVSLESQNTQPTCVRTPTDPFTHRLLAGMLGGLVPGAVCMFVLAVVGGLVCYYIRGPHVKLPQSTDMVHINEKWQMFQPEKPLIINLNLVTTKLSVGDPSLGFLGAPQHFTTETERLLPVSALPLPSAPGANVTDEPCEGHYATQNLPWATGSEAASENTSEDASNAASGAWCDGGFPDDSYGLVLHTLLQQDKQQDEQQDKQQDVGGSTEALTPDVRVEQPSVCEVQLYRAQSREGGAGEERYEGVEEEEKDEGGLQLDWSPQTGVLKIPLICPFGLEDRDRSTTEPSVEERVELSVGAELLQQVPVLTSVMVRQCSEECREEDVFTEMEKVWGLQIQSSPE